MTKLILGVATNSKGKYKSRIDGKKTKSYMTWKSMLQRAYCPKYHVTHPTYIGCSVAEEWLEYQEFGDWYDKHEYSNRGYHLDKDILLHGNKIYTPDRCVFVPQQLNSLLNDNGNARGQYKQGVSFYKRDNNFAAHININGKKKGLGLFNTEQEAYQAYKAAKEAYVKEKALEWQDRIADNVFDALMNWELG